MQGPVAFSEDRVFVSATEIPLWDGCDWTLYGVTVLGCFLLALASFILCGQHWLALGICLAVILALYFFVRWVLRDMARLDPLHFVVYRRGNLYQSTYAAQSKLLPVSVARIHTIRPVAGPVPKRKLVQ